MSATLIAILTAGAGGGLTLLLVWAVGAMRTGASLPHRMERLEVVVVRIAKETSVQTGALKATLEALKGQCNGNVDEALIAIRDLEEESKDFYTARAVGAKA